MTAARPVGPDDGDENVRHAEAVDALSRGVDLAALWTEIESGRSSSRLELGHAPHFAKITGATLVIAKLNRLSRNAAFLLTLRDSGVHFLAVDMPEANDLTVGIMALVARAQDKAISLGGSRRPWRWHGRAMSSWATQARRQPA